MNSEPFTLETANTQMVFLPTDKGWRVMHYGAKLPSAADVCALAKERMYIRHDMRCASHDSYPAFGADRTAFQMNTFGAIQARHADGSLTIQWKAGSAEFVPDCEGVQHLVLTLNDALLPFHAVQHFRAHFDSDVVETWVEIFHEEDDSVELSRMDSFGLEFSNLAHEYHVTSLSGNWGCEAVVSEQPIELGTKFTLGCRSGVRSSWGNHPAFMLGIGGRASEESGEVLAGCLAWCGSWEISIEHAFSNLLQINAGAAPIGGAYILDPGKRLTLPKFIFTYSASGKGQASRALHKWARNTCMPHGTQLRDVLLNSWEGAYFSFDEKVLTDMMDGVCKLGGELFVIDDGWFGRGKFARDDDKRGLGDWNWNSDKLPNGVAYLVSEAKKRGLKLGLWFEPEMANTTSHLYTEHPDWVIHENGRPLRQGRGGTQVVLDMANPAVQNYIFDQIHEILETAGGISYIKWDANADFLNAGSAYLDAKHQSNLWFDYTTGVFALFDRLRKAHPDVIFQACCSGGGHADYAWLSRADEIWGSDNACAQQRIFIQWGEELFFPASAVAAHITEAPNHVTGRDAPLKLRCDVAMSGRLGVELRPSKMSADEIDFARSAIENYKRLRAVIQQGDLYRLVSPYGSDHSALMFASPDKRKAVVMVYGMSRMAIVGNPEALKLTGLAPDLRYHIKELNIDKRGSHIASLEGATISGEALRKFGLPFRLGNEDDSLVVELTAD